MLRRGVASGRPLFLRHPSTVIPAKAGIQEHWIKMDSRLRGNDGCGGVERKGSERKGSDPFKYFKYL